MRLLYILLSKYFGFRTSKSFYLTVKRCREMKWLLTATVVCGMGKIISFSSVVRPHKFLAPCPALQPPPPDRRFAAHPPTEGCLLKHSALMPTFFLLKLCPTGSVKTRYQRHNLYTRMSPPEFDCGDGTQRERDECAGISPKRAHGWCQSLKLFHPGIALACTWLSLTAMWPVQRCLINDPHISDFIFFFCHFDTLFFWS